ncbi:dihydrofolate reductase family protein [Candidatus Woesearchaeota archaeon]|nr:dihydrofolate reductase family protein [Candidatus Woesearchaeota archaeon]
MKKPTTTLFMISSLDGKISTGFNDQRDIDKDFPKIKGLKEGLKQYYELEQKTDLHSLNTGRVMAKIGVNSRKETPNKITVSFIIIDNKPHLNKQGVEYLTKWLKKLYIITTNKNHPAFNNKSKNLEIIYYKEIDFKDLFDKLKQKYNINRLTIQSGGILNSILLRKGLIDYISLVIAPCLIGGSDTPSLIGGKSLISEEDLKHIKTLKLQSCKNLKNSYLHLKYKVLE